MYKILNLSLLILAILILSCSRQGSNQDLNPPPPPPPPPGPSQTYLHGWWKATQLYYPSGNYFASPRLYFASDGFHFEVAGAGLGTIVGTWSWTATDSLRLTITGGIGIGNHGMRIAKLTRDTLIAYINTYYTSYIKLDSAVIDSKPISSIAGTGTRGFSGDGGPASAAQIDGGRICIDAANNLYLTTFDRIRKITAATGIIQTIAGTGTSGHSGDGGPAISAQIRAESVAVDANGNVFFADDLNHCIRRINAANGGINTIAGIPGPHPGFAGDGGSAINAQLGRPSSLCLDSGGNLFFFDAFNQRIRKIAAATGIITTVAGNGTLGTGGDGGPALSAQLFPGTIAIDKTGNIFIADGNTFRIRKITASTGLINTIAGTGVKGYDGEGIAATSSKLNEIHSIYPDASGNLYFGEATNPRIRKLATDGKIYTVAGTGFNGYTGEARHATAVDIGASLSLLLDSQGNILFTANLRIRKINGN